MSAAEHPLGITEQARVALANLRETLLAPTPEELERCYQQLKAATESLRELKPGPKTGREPPAGETALAESRRSELLALHRDARQVHQLLEQAGAFYLGWTQIMLSASGSYTANGEIAAPATDRGLSLEG